MWLFSCDSGQIRYRASVRLSSAIVYQTRLSNLAEIGGCTAWPSRPRNNDDTASCKHVHVYKHCHCVALQFASASLNDPLMSAVGVHGQLLSVNLNLSDGSDTIGAVGQLDSASRRRWHVGWGIPVS